VEVSLQLKTDLSKASNVISVRAVAKHFGSEIIEKNTIYPSKYE